MFSRSFAAWGAWDDSIRINYDPPGNNGSGGKYHVFWPWWPLRYGVRHGIQYEVARMIQLPEGFNASSLYADFFGLAAPFAGIAFIIACGFLIANMLKNAPK